MPPQVLSIFLLCESGNFVIPDTLKSHGNEVCVSITKKEKIKAKPKRKVKKKTKDVQIPWARSLTLEEHMCEHHKHT